MKSKNLIPLILAALASHASAFNEETTRRGDELITLLQAEMKELAGADGDNNQAQAIRQFLRQVQAAMTQGRGRSLDQYLDSLGNYEPSEKVQQSIDLLKKTARDEYEENTRAVIRELRGIMDAAREAVTRATEPEELDKPMVSLSRNRYTNSGDGEGYDSNDPDVRSLLSEINGARQFVTGWQDYLQASNSGDIDRALQLLDGLSNQENPLIPRSRIIARIAFERPDPEEIARITASISTLDDMKDGIAKLSAMAGSTRYSSRNDNPELSGTIAALTKLEKTYREYLAGLSVNLSQFYGQRDVNGAPRQEGFLALRAQLLLLVLPRGLDLPDPMRVEKDESVDAFLKRALAAAVARGDAALIRRLHNTLVKLTDTAIYEPRDLQGLDDCTVARMRLAAGQNALAVVSFQKALASGSPLVPVAEVGSTLARIQQEKPADFEKGMQDFLTLSLAQQNDPAGPRMPQANPPETGRKSFGIPIPTHPDKENPLFRHLLGPSSGRGE